MPNREYQKGYRAELELVHKARALGLFARRSAGSKGPYDVFIASDRHQWLVDVKVNNWAPPASRIALSDLASSFTTCVLANRVTGGVWYFRPINKDASMGEISTDAPWHIPPS